MKIAIIFGGSGFLGKAVVDYLYNHGFKIVSTYNSHVPDQESYSENISYHPCDITVPDQVASVISFTLSRYGVPDVVINASGIALRQSLLCDIPPDSIRDVIAADLLGPLYISREAVKVMHGKHAGIIIHVSSMWGSCGASCEVPYSAAKGGLNSLVKALAKEVGPDGIRVNAVAPGLLLSPMNSHLTEEDLNYFKEDTPLGCFTTVEDVCRSIMYLIESPHVTGQILAVDGGIVI